MSLLIGPVRTIVLCLSLLVVVVTGSSSSSSSSSYSIVGPPHHGNVRRRTSGYYYYDNGNNGNNDNNSNNDDNNDGGYDGPLIWFSFALVAVGLQVRFLWKAHAQCKAEKKRLHVNPDWHHDVRVAKIVIFESSNNGDPVLPRVDDDDDNDKIAEYYKMEVGAHSLVSMKKASGLRNVVENEDTDDDGEKTLTSNKKLTSHTLRNTKPTAKEPTSGSYTGSHWEVERQYYSRTDIEFQAQKRGQRVFWKMAGKGNNADGNFEITEGWVAPCGKAYWLQQQGECRVLHTGIFDFVTCTYQGRWHADNGQVCENFTMRHEKVGRTFLSSALLRKAEKRSRRMRTKLQFSETNVEPYHPPRYTATTHVILR